MLTGKTRHRSSSILGSTKLVLQVEYTASHTKDLNGSGYYDDWTTTHWRDARVEDLTVLQSVQPAV